MEKGTPDCKLPVVKALVEVGKVRTTYSAELGAAQLGLKNSDILTVVMSLTPSCFYQIMTTHADHKAWQDVYHAKTASGTGVYLKLTVVEDVLIVSFKEL
jgi:motility quorum-sensing regulator/GCU-specific mRNA interferase toxin